MNEKRYLVLEIARGDTIEQLLEAGVICRASFWGANGYTFRGFEVCGGTTVEAEVEGNTVHFAGLTKKWNAYGFGHGQRPIYKQYQSGASLIHEVFIG